MCYEIVNITCCEDSHQSKVIKYLYVNSHAIVLLLSFPSSPYFNSGGKRLFLPLHPSFLPSSSSSSSSFQGHSHTEKAFSASLSLSGIFMHIPYPSSYAYPNSPTSCSTKLNFFVFHFLPHPLLDPSPSAIFCSSSFVLRFELSFGAYLAFYHQWSQLICSQVRGLYPQDFPRILLSPSPSPSLPIDSSPFLTSWAINAELHVSEMRIWKGSYDPLDPVHVRSSEGLPTPRQIPAILPDFYVC